jgi:hypothetical protein
MKTNRSCAYCGSPKNITADHVPPKGLFRKPRPSNLITVPACGRCHDKTSLDDEYFVQRIALREDAGGHPAAQARWESIIRALARTEAGGFRRQLMADLGDADVRTPAGTWVGRAPTYNVQLERIFRVVRRTVLGLFFHHSGRRLRDDFIVMVQSEETLAGLPTSVLDDLRDDVLAPLSQVQPVVIGDDVFAYWHAFGDEEPNVSAWRLAFYGCVGFLALTGIRPAREHFPDPAPGGAFNTASRSI